jgi:polyisoprenoid-binding protein YceI
MIFLACLTAFGAEAQQALAIDAGSVTFQIKNAGLTVEGSFGEVAINAVFAEEHPAGSSFSGTVQVASIDTGVGARDRHLLKEEYFDAAQHPSIVMQSKSISRAAAGRYEGRFLLTLKGVTKEVPMVFDVSQTGGRRAFSGQFTLNRRDFGVGGNSWILSDQVTIRVAFTAQ